MTREEFRTASVALLGSVVGWQSAIARRLGVDSRTVRRWLAVDGPLPEWVGEKLAELMGGVAPGPWPRDEWVVGDAVGADGRRREYVVHLAPPRFVARVVALDPDGQPEQPEEPADVSSGVCYAVDDATLLCEIDWIDTPPPAHITALLEAAADAVERDGSA